ncbi:MAG TPA: TIGR02206 family membrane protein [Candidatus Dormibacteraeota bacterium]|nr:TIGR02206 family membrane protein [Candidatus Dormibacteraeota bacterium]
MHAHWRPMSPEEHVLPLLVIAVVIATVLFATRRWPGRWVDQGARVIAVAVVLAEVGWWVISIATGTWTLQWSLPLHLCEAGCFLAAAALWWRARFAFEMSYFWGLGGTLPGLFSPSIPGNFPDPVFFQYYAQHGLLVLGAFYLVVALRMRPAQRAVLRVSLATATYALAVGVVDFLTNGNYLFLRDLPPTKTFLDYMGPWPWYIVTLAVAAIVMFNLLYLPFARSARTLEAAASTA